MRSSSILSFDSWFDKNIMAFVTGCLVDFTLKDNKLSFNRHQKKFLSSFKELQSDRFNFMKQVHGKRIIVFKNKGTPRRSSAGCPLVTGRLQKGDGMMTQKIGIPLTVRTADCLSVFIYDPKQQAIALVHAGWKGTQKKIVANAIGLMKKKFNSNPADLKAAFGPSIRKCCYEVGEEFKKYFPKEIKIFVGARRAVPLRYLDLPLANKHQLLKAGVRAENIYDCRICTCCNPKYFSFRRDGKKAGRMLSVMMLK